MKKLMATGVPVASCHALRHAHASALDGLRVRVREVENIGVEHTPTLGTLDELRERVVFTDLVEL